MSETDKPPISENPSSASTNVENTVVSKKIGTGSNFLHLIYAFGKHVGKIAIVYMFGYFNISPAWLLGPVVLAVLREEWSKEKELKRNIAKAAALSNEKDVILARVDDLPAWVFFPDIERAEWVNRILSQLWPNVNHYAKDLIKDTIEPSIQETLKMYNMSGFSFQKMRLGSIPPRLGGVKVYDKNISREEIIMDMDIFYAGDCDISFTLRGLSGGIKDLQLHGMVRVVMKPLIRTIPLVGGLQIYFLNSPTIDFNLVGVADLLDMPGLSDVLRKVIVEQVSAMMVLPNKLSIVLSDKVLTRNLKFPEPQGVLRVHVIEAKQLMKKDIGMLGKGKSDPYAIITLGSESFRTPTIDNTTEPKWDFWCEFPIDAISGQMLNLQLMDADDLKKKDSKLGKHWKEAVIQLQPTIKHDSYQMASCPTRYDWIESKGPYTYRWQRGKRPHMLVPQQFVSESFKGLLRAFIYDKDKTGKDESLGRATVEVFGVSEKGQMDTWITLEEAKTGMVHLRLSWLILTDSLEDYKTALAETQMLRVTNMSTSVLMVFVDSAKNLPRPGTGKSANTPPDPQFSLSVGRNTKLSQIIYRTDHPVFEKEFVFLVSNPQTDTLHLKVTDTKSGTELGKLSYNLSTLLDRPGLELEYQPLPLKSTNSDAKISLALKLRFLKHPQGSIQDADELSLYSRQSSTSTPQLPRAASIKKQDSASSISIKSGVSDSGGVVEKSVFKTEEGMVHSAPPVSAPPAETSGLHLRQASTTLYSAVDGGSLGKIKLTLRYSVQRQRLIVVVLQIMNLPLKDPNNIPDPYVKLYLLPERSKESKRKTETVKDNCNPVFDETFEYVMSQGELSGRQLEVTVLTQKTWKSPVLGQVIINLSELDLSSAVTAWYELEPELTKEKEL